MGLHAVDEERGSDRRDRRGGLLTGRDEHPEQRALSGHKRDGVVARLHGLRQIGVRLSLRPARPDTPLQDRFHPGPKGGLVGHAQRRAARKQLPQTHRSQALRERTRQLFVVLKVQLLERPQVAERGWH